MPVYEDKPLEMETFATGAVRSADRKAEAYELLSPIGMRRGANAAAEGEVKYSPYNWEKGMSVRAMLRHAIGHIYMYLAGDRSEDHLGHLVWNAMGACHSEELWPHLNTDLRTEGCKPPCDSASSSCLGNSAGPSEPRNILAGATTNGEH